jgi:hypothetical protein
MTGEKLGDLALHAMKGDCAVWASDIAPFVARGTELESSEKVRGALSFREPLAD